VKARRLTIAAALAASAAAGVLAAAGTAGTKGIPAGNIVYSAIDPADGMADIYARKSDGTTVNISDDDAGQARKDLSPVVSPNGRKVVFTRLSAEGGSSIMVVNLDGTGLTNLTSPAVSDSTNIDPSWSPDGSKVVFASNRDGNYDLYYVKMGSTQAFRLTRTSAPVRNVDPVWSPNGSTIVFSRSGHRATSVSGLELFQLKVDNLQTARLTATTGAKGDRGAVFSPDGNSIAFYSDRSGGNDLYLLRLGGPAVRLSTAQKGNTEPSFSPDGSALVYISNRTGATELWSYDLIGVTPGPREQQLTKDGVQKSHPSWGPVEAQVPSPIDPPAPVTSLPRPALSSGK
jgi:Tol biopolymer transport system component